MSIHVHQFWMKATDAKYNKYHAKMSTVVKDVCAWSHPSFYWYDTDFPRIQSILKSRCYTKRMRTGHDFRDPLTWLRPNFVKVLTLCCRRKCLVHLSLGNVNNNNTDITHLFVGIQCKISIQAYVYPSQRIHQGQTVFSLAVLLWQG